MDLRALAWPLFYPPGLPRSRELAFAAARFGTIEINGTFYRTQTPKTFAKWRAETPDDFLFAVKAPRYATNRRRLADSGESIARFLASGLDRLEDRLGPINWQLPPTRPFDRADVAAFLALLPETLGARHLRHAIEVRHPSFAGPEFQALARRPHIAVVQAGDSPYPEIEAPGQDFAYIRIMGNRPGGYPPERLDHWVAQARRHAAADRDVFLFVIGGEKALNPKAATALRDRLSG